MGTQQKPLVAGDHVPWFRVPALSGSPRYAFDTVAGRHALLLFFGSAREAESAAALDLVRRHRALFDDDNACFFGVTCDPRDEKEGRIAQQLPGIRFFLDYDRAVSGLYGAADGGTYQPYWMLVGPDLRVLARFPLAEGERAVEALRSRLQDTPPDIWAPVLVVPDVLEPEMCRHLVGLYEAEGGEESGFMREVDGKTVALLDANHKRRKDYQIADEALQKALVARIVRRLVPAIQRSFQFEATRIERYIVACYEAGAGHFRPHRDNTTKGTAHRRFAVTINLNAGEYEGGDLRFPEFGTRTYRAPTGGAVVFSCSLLHEATPVTKGRRYAFLPFLYNEEGAALRERNLVYLDENLSAAGYRSDKASA